MPTLNIPEHIAALHPYIPGLPVSDVARRVGMAPSDIAKLASNENPLGTSPAAMAALRATPPDLSRYPDNGCTELVAAIADKHGVPADGVIVGAGSESVISIVTAAFLGAGRKTAFSQYSFQAYPNAVQRVAATSIVVPSPEFVVDLDALSRTVDEKPSLIYIANPGNPTGTCLDPDALAHFIARLPAHLPVLLDEAYFEYMPPELRGDSIALVRRHPNVVLTRTFSKAYGLAGLRVGYGIAQPAMADILRRVRPPFTVSEAAQIAATAALGDDAFIDRTREINEQSRQLLCAELNALSIRFLPSVTNFVLAQVGDGAGLAQALERHGLIVRPVGAYGLRDWVRISLGTPDEMRRLGAALRAVIPL
jgi:histidinol-phosphate aminotransferase